MKNTSLELVMDNIENQSEFYFIFNQKQIDVGRVVNIQAENKLIAEILPELFEGTNVNYLILDRKILLTTDPIDNFLNQSSLLTRNQRFKVTGTVSDAATNEPIIGANVMIEGTTTGLITDLNGKFSIEVSGSDAVLIVSFLGYNTEHIQISGKSELEIKLVPNITQLEEIVVIGYGSAKKSDLTGQLPVLVQRTLIRG